MKVKLYIDNDSRPRGAYENVSHAEEYGDILIFKTATGKVFHTNLRYCLEVEEGDMEHWSSDRLSGSFRTIVGRPKPKPKAAKAKAQQPSFFTPDVPSSAVPKKSEFAGADTDEMFRKRTFK